MCLSDAHHPPWCARQHQLHLACCAPCLLAPERLQRLSLIGGASDLLGRLLRRGFCGLVWRWQVPIRVTVFWGYSRLGHLYSSPKFRSGSTSTCVGATASMASVFPEIASNPALIVCACTSLVSPSSFLLSSCSKSRLTLDRPYQTKHCMCTTNETTFFP